jgi:hypothetical protein
MGSVVSGRCRGAYRERTVRHWTSRRSRIVVCGTPSALPLVACALTDTPSASPPLMSHALNHLDDDPPPLVDVVDERGPQRRFARPLVGLMLLTAAGGALLTMTALGLTLGPRPATAVLRCSGRAAAIADWVVTTANRDAVAAGEPTGDHQLRVATTNLPTLADGERVSLEGRTLSGRYLDTGHELAWTVTLTETADQVTRGAVRCGAQG